MSFIVHRVAKHAARYTDAGGREKCGYCRFFVAPRSCGKVIGPVSPAGWCKYFSRQMVSQFGGSIVTSGIPAGATLALDFMSSGNLPAGVTFTRASTATYIDASGVIQTAAVNQPRWDYAGGSLRGLLIEEARTNLFLNSATLGTQSVAVTAQAYTLSFYGTGTVTKSGAATGALVGTGAGQRVSQTFTPTAGTLTCTVTGSVTNAQIEAGSMATSWIPTTGVSVTRAGDSCIIPPANTGFYTSPGGSWMAEFIPLAVAASGNLGIIGYPVAGNPAQLYVQPTREIGQWDASAVAVTANAATVGAVSKTVSTWGASTGRICLNGGAIASAALTLGYPNVGGFGVGIMISALPTVLTGYIRRVQYWPRILSDAEMLAVTT
jgi:hypothetical protein